MKFIALGDIHLTDKRFACRTDDIWETQFKKLEYLLEAVKGNAQEPELIISGDLFDKPRSWYLLPEIIKLFDAYLDRPALVVFGQHDTYLYSEGTRANTSLGILEAAGFVRILSEEPITLTEGGSNSTYIYGCSFGQQIPKPRNAKLFNVLVIHANISDIEMNPNMKYAKANIFMRENPAYNLIICGDQHRKFSKTRDGRLIVNSGPMLRKTADLLLHEPGFWNIDTNGKKVVGFDWMPLPFAPAEDCMKVVQEVVENSEMDVDDLFLGDFIKSIKEMENKGTDFLAILTTVLKKYEGSDNVRNILSKMLLERQTK